MPSVNLEYWKQQFSKVWNWKGNILLTPMKFSTDHVLTQAVSNQSTPTFQWFKSYSIHDENFKIHTGLTNFKKVGYISINTRRFWLFHIQTGPSRRRHWKRAPNKSTWAAFLPFKIQMVPKCNVLYPWEIEIFRVLHHVMM